MATTETERECGVAGDVLMDPVEAMGLAAMAKTLSDPVRLRVYAHIASSVDSTVCACHLPDQLGISQPTLSHHLKKLVEAGLVDREYRGRWAHYSPLPEALNPLREFLDASAVPHASH